MLKLVDKDKRLTLFALGLFTYMCINNDLCLTWLLPTSFMYIGGLIIPILCGYIVRVKTINKILFFTIVYFIYYWLLHPSFYQFLGSMSMIVSIMSIIVLPIEKKRSLFELLKSYFTIIIAVSLIGWLLHMGGVSLPYENVSVNDFHNDINNYYIFSTSNAARYHLFERFSGMFLEAGQMATPCVFFVFADGGSLKDRRNIVLLVAIILSFSLVAYIMLTVGYFYRSLILNRHHLFLKVFIPICVVVAAGGMIIKNANENNPLYAMILARLEADDDKIIAGNNRTNDYVDYRFQALMKSPDKYLGIASEIARSNDDWTASSSGYKKYIIHNGLIGLILLLALFYSAYSENKSAFNSLLLLLAVLAFIPRSMLTKGMWLFPLFLGFYLNSSNKLRVININNG